MRLRVSKTNWKVLGGIFASCVLVVSFENCGKAGFDTGSDDSAELSSGLAVTGNAAPGPDLVGKYGEAQAELVQAIPFGIHASFDQISYNSCAGSSVQSGTGFSTLIAGAYTSGGVTYSTPFFNYLNANFPPLYPSTVLTTEQVEQYMGDSPRNSGAVPTMAVRTAGDYNTVHSTSSTAVLGTDIIEMIGSLTDPLAMQGLTTQGSSLNYLPFASSKVLEASLSYNSSLGLAQNVRNDLMGSGVLAITYMLPSGASNEVRAPTDYDGSGYTGQKTVAYGRSYQMVFSNAVAPMGGQSPDSRNPNNILTQVREFDLENPTAALSTWNCNSARRYMVVQAADAPTVCPTENYATLANASYIAELAIVRRQFRADQWDVNIGLRCMVPKNSASCYDGMTDASTNLPVPINYSRNFECYNPAIAATNPNAYPNGTVYQLANGSTSTDPLQMGFCAQFVTICTAN